MKLGQRKRPSGQPANGNSWRPRESWRSLRINANAGLSAGMWRQLAAGGVWQLTSGGSQLMAVAAAGNAASIIGVCGGRPAMWRKHNGWRKAMKYHVAWHGHNIMAACMAYQPAKASAWLGGAS